MLIELEDLEIHPVDFREEFSPGAIDLGPEVRQRSPLRSEGRADLVEEHHGKHKVVQDIRVKGKLERAWKWLVRAALIRSCTRWNAASIFCTGRLELTPATKSFR